MVFRIFTGLCNHHHYLIPEHFPHCQGTPYPSEVSHHVPLTFSPSPRRPRILCLSLYLRLFCTFYTNGIIQPVVFFVSGLFHSAWVFKAHACCRMSQYPVPSYWGVTRHTLFLHSSDRSHQPSCRYVALRSRCNIFRAISLPLDRYRFRRVAFVPILQMSETRRE